jgi:HEAT repeat protein
MTFYKVKHLLFLIFLFEGLIYNQVSANSSDSLVNSQESVNQDTVLYKSYGAEYESVLTKADRAYRFGFYRRAKKYYEKASLKNPTSTYIKFQLKEIQEKSTNFRNYIFYFNFDKPDLLIKSITYLIVYFLISMLLILLVILVNRNRMDSIENKKQQLKEKYQSLLVDFLFSEEKISNVPHEIGKIAASSFNRRLLIDQMIDLSINLTGEAKNNLRSLFLLLKLEKDSLKKAYSKQWHVKVKGFRELAFMDITAANPEIIRCLLSKNEIVRMEAQMSMVRLNHEDAFGFLDHLAKSFTQWEQLSIYETIMFHNLAIPSFDRWLFSKNKSVVLFALRMIDVFKQKEAYSNLFWMLMNEDPEVRNLTIKVIGNLKIKEALPHIKRLYKNETYENCLAIIRAMAKMPDESVLNFLKLVLDKEGDAQLQIEAAMAINNHGELGKLTLKKLMDSDYKNYQIIIKHVIDKRIN